MRQQLAYSFSLPFPSRLEPSHYIINCNERTFQWSFVIILFFSFLLSFALLLIDKLQVSPSSYLERRSEWNEEESNSVMANLCFPLSDSCCSSFHKVDNNGAIGHRALGNIHLNTATVVP